MITPEYLAGFFDGEGTFYIGTQKAKNPNNPKKYPHCIVLLSQSGDNGLSLFKEIQAIYGGNIYTHLRVGEHKATKTAYKIYWNKQEAIRLIEILLPHLKIKQQEAKEAFSYLTRTNDI